ncbi:MAG: hypothetical protein JNM94_16480 [Phycisphaerae bacterium]|nr:hypothetical protein [Phycisphaerae bacterium]
MPIKEPMILRAVLLGSVLVLPSLAAAQNAAPPKVNAAPPKSTAAPAATPATEAPAVAVPGTTVAAPRRAPLLREGSFIARSAGALRLDTKRNEWIFAPDARDSSGLQRELVVLPNETLGEAVRTIGLSPRELRFEATGQIFIYQGRNFLLLTMATPVAPATTSSPADAAPTPAPPPTKPNAKPPAKPAPVDEEKIAEELERQLIEKIQSVPKATVPAPAAESTAETRSAPAEAALPTQPSMRIQSRRGHLLRDSATGGWRFVFEGQLPDGTEPSMPVLPCLALERVESMIRLAESQVPILVSGMTTSFEGRTFLLPTSFRLARGGKGMNP